MKAIFSISTLPTIEYFSILNQYDEIILDNREIYRKQCNRNRFHILSPNGIQKLNIPIVHHGMYQSPVSDIKISYAENWQIKHLRSIESAYNNSPYYEFYKDSFAELFLKREKYLFDYNMSLLNYCLSKMKINVAIKTTLKSEEDLTGLKNFKRISDSKNTEIIFPELFEAKKYNQVFSYKFGFVQNLSVIDLLFNTGPNAISYL